MDPDYYTKKIKFKLFSKLYAKIALYSIPIILSIITMFVLFGPTLPDNDSSLPEQNEVAENTFQTPQVLAVSDADLASGGVIFGISTIFGEDAKFNTNLTVEQTTTLNGELYYQGELVDLSIITEGFELDPNALSTILEEGTGISITGDEVLQINNTGVISFNGLTGDVVYDIPEPDPGSAQSIFKNILVPGASSIIASTNNDSLTFIPGNGIELATDAVGKTITITSSSASSGVNTITGIPNQVIVTRVGQDVILSLPQDFHTAASVKFSEMRIADPITAVDVLSLTSGGRISTLNNADLFLGSNSTGNIELISKGVTSLLLNGADMVASGSLTGVTDFSVSGEIEVTSFDNGIVQSQGYKLSSGPINLASSNHVSGVLPPEYGGTGTDNIPADGQLLVGSGLTGQYEPRHLGAGTGISVTRGPYSLSIANTGVTKVAGGVNHILVNGSYSPTGVTGEIMLTLPQVLHPSASPTFAGITITSPENMIRFNDSDYHAYLSLEELTSNRSYTLPNESGTICLTSGNCVGIGGGLIGLGTANYIAKYSDSGTLTNSSIYDNGSSVGIGTTLPLLGVALDINGSLRIGATGGEYDILNVEAADGDPLSSLFWGSRILCDSTGSCAGTAGSGVSSTGTDGYLALFANSGSSIANSLIYSSESAVGIGTTTLSGFVTISGGNENAALAINQTNSLGDILSASIEGTEMMKLSSIGDLDLVSGVYKNQGNTGATVSGFACVMTSGGIVTGSGDCPTDPSAEIWDSQSSLVFAQDTDKNFAIGGSTVNNAKFAVINVASGDSTIWLRQSPTRTLSLTSSGTIKTINDDNITLESGEDIVLSPGSGDVVIDGKIVTPTSSDLVIEPEGILHVRPHGQQVMSVATSGVGINTTLSQGALTIKELFSYAIPGEDTGGGGIDGNLILNPANSDFSSNTGNWSLGSGWTISGGTLSYTMGQNSSATLENQYIGNYIQGGTTYTISFDVLSLNMSGPEAMLNVQVGNNTQLLLMENPDWFGNGSIKRHSRSFTPSNSGNLSLSVSNNMNIVIDNISVTSASIEPPPPEPPPSTESGPGVVIVSSDGSASPLEMRAGGSGLYNSFIGYLVGGLNESGQLNSGFGALALQSLSSGQGNSAFGYESLMTNASGSDNAAFGSKALRLATGSSNSAFGASSLLNTSTGEFNTGVGAHSLFTNTTGASNSAVGYFALNKNSTGIHNTAMGANALRTATTASRNTALGSEALFNNTTGSNNVGLGYQSMYNYRSGNSTAIGYQAMFTNQTGAAVTAIGYQALYNATGASNTAIGSNALKGVTSGVSNIGLGASAGYGTTTGSYNVNIGEGTSYSNTAGSNNTVIGYNALMWGTSGSNNTSIGYQAGYRLDGGVGNVFIGANAGPSSFATFSNQLYIANAAGSPLIWGDFSSKKVGINLATPTSANNTVSVAGSMCVTTTGVCSQNTSGTIYTTNTVVTGADLAENYVSSQVLQPGDVVSMANNGNSQAVVKATGASKNLLGVVSTAPGVTLNSEAQTDSVHKYVYPIALSGRVPTKVSTENGSISVGDPLTLGSTAGVAVKAKKSGYIIGRALEAHSGSGTATIVIYAHASWYAPLIVDGDGNINSGSGQQFAKNTVPVPGLPSTSDSYDETINTLNAKISGLEDRIKKLEEDLLFIDEVKESNNKSKPVASEELPGSLQDANLESASISGSLQIGALTIDSGSFNTIGKSLHLQSNSTENIEMFSGVITFAANGDIVTTGTIKADKIEIDSEESEDVSIGVGTIPEGEKSVTISTKAVTEKSNIFITVKTLYSKPLAVTEQEDNESFTVETEDAVPKDILFNWWIVN